MENIGIDISVQQSKKISDLDWEKANYAITLCGSANETCVSMSWPATCTKLHWPIEDPVSQKDYDLARDEIYGRLSDFVKRQITSIK